MRTQNNVEIWFLANWMNDCSQPIIDNLESINVILNSEEACNGLTSTEIQSQHQSEFGIRGVVGNLNFNCTHRQFCGFQI